ncbi:dipeptidase [Sulfodiicoccus acidiphilus]|nr:membrane dipeptidase [Sulfodiicoccus acidiphilus]
MRFVDLHQDFAFSSFAGRDVIGGNVQSSLKSLSSFQEVVVFGSLFPHVYTDDERGEALTAFYTTPNQATFSSADLLWAGIRFYLYLERSGKACLVRSLSDVNGDGVRILLSLEGTDVLRDPLDLYPLWELGVRAVGLTWNYDTKFAASRRSKRDYGLTGEGEELVKIANGLGMILDVAHSSKKTVIDVCSASKRPVIASHANVSKVKEHGRNLDDEELEAIVKTDGVVGITAIPPTLPTNDLRGLLENMNYVGETFGWRHVALGTDFLGIREENLPQGFEDVSKVVDLARELEGRAEQVLWENPIRVIRAHL